MLAPGFMAAAPLAGSNLAGSNLADNNFGDIRAGGLAGPMGLFIILLLVIVTVLLIRNMSMRIRRLPERFPGQDEPDGSAATGAAPADPEIDNDK